MIVSLEAIFLSTFVMISQNRADAKRQVIADEQWKTVKEEDRQNVQLIHLSKQILDLTEEVRSRMPEPGGVLRDFSSINPQTRLEDLMFVTPASFDGFGVRLTRDAAEQLARNWTYLLFNGLVLIVAGVLIWSIDWSVSSLSTFIGALFIFEGLWIDADGGHLVPRRATSSPGCSPSRRASRSLPGRSPSLIVLGIFLGSWLIVVGTISVSGAFAARRLMADWWLLLILGVAEVTLGVLALADPGATLAALITVGGIWAVVIGAMRVVLAFQIRHLPQDVDAALGAKGEGAPAT